MRYLKQIPSGHIYVWTDYLAERSDMVDIESPFGKPDVAETVSSVVESVVNETINDMLDDENDESEEKPYVRNRRARKRSS